LYSSTILAVTIRDSLICGIDCEDRGTTAKDKDESDGEGNEAKNPKESSFRLAPPRAVTKVTARMVEEYNGSNELVREYRTMLMKVKRDIRLKRPAFFVLILSTMTASSSSLVQLHPDYGDAEANHDVFKLVAIDKETHLDNNLEEEAMRLEMKLGFSTSTPPSRFKGDGTAMMVEVGLMNS
jgi:hypothetical protein